jgi:hypothetical protein
MAGNAQISQPFFLGWPFVRRCREAFARLQAWFRPELKHLIAAIDENAPADPEPKAQPRLLRIRRAIVGTLSALAGPKRDILVLQVPPEQVLEQKVTLPEATLRRLGSVIENGLSQWSPFSSEDVYVAASPSPVDRSAKTFVLHLKYVLRRDAEPLIAAISSSPRALPVLALGGSDWIAPIDRALSRRWLARERIVRLMMAACIPMALLFWTAINWRLDAAAEVTRTERQFVEQQLRRVADQLEQQQKRIAAFKFVDAAAGNSLGQLAQRISTALPSDLAITSIDLQRERVIVSYSGPVSSSLITELKALPWLEAVTEQRTQASDQVTLTLAIKRAGAP